MSAIYYVHAIEAEITLQFFFYHSFYAVHHKTKMARLGIQIFF